MNMTMNGLPDQYSPSGNESSIEAENLTSRQPTHGRTTRWGLKFSRFLIRTVVFSLRHILLSVLQALRVPLHFILRPLQVIGILVAIFVWVGWDSADPQKTHYLLMSGGIGLGSALFARLFDYLVSIIDPN